MSTYKKELQSLIKEYGLEKDKEAKNMKQIRSSQLNEINENLKNAEAELYEITNQNNLRNNSYKSLYNNSKNIVEKTASKQENLVKRFEKDLARIIQERSNNSRKKTLKSLRKKNHSKVRNVTRNKV